MRKIFLSLLVFLLLLSCTEDNSINNNDDKKEPCALRPFATFGLILKTNQIDSNYFISKFNDNSSYTWEIDSLTGDTIPICLDGSIALDSGYFFIDLFIPISDVNDSLTENFSHYYGNSLYNHFSASCDSLILKYIEKDRAINISKDYKYIPNYDSIVLKYPDLEELYRVDVDILDGAIDGCPSKYIKINDLDTLIVERPYLMDIGTHGEFNRIELRELDSTYLSQGYKIQMGDPYMGRSSLKDMLNERIRNGKIVGSYIQKVNITEIK